MLRVLAIFHGNKPEVLRVHEVPDIYFSRKYLTLLPGAGSICTMLQRSSEYQYHRVPVISAFGAPGTHEYPVVSAPGTLGSPSTQPFRLLML